MHMVASTAIHPHPHPFTQIPNVPHTHTHTPFPNLHQNLRSYSKTLTHRATAAALTTPAGVSVILLEVLSSRRLLPEPLLTVTRMMKSLSPPSTWSTNCGAKQSRMMEISIGLMCCGLIVLTSALHQDQSMVLACHNNNSDCCRTLWLAQAA